MEAPQKRNYHINLLVFSDYDQSDYGALGSKEVDVIPAHIFIFKVQTVDPNHST